MNKFLQLTRLEWKLQCREPLTIFFALVFPVMMLLIFGTMYGNEPSEFMGGYGTVDVSVPAYICMIVAVTGLMALPLTLAQYRERKILKRLMATPLDPRDVLLSQLTVNALTTLAGILLLVIVAKIVYGLHFSGNLVITFFAFLLVLLSIFAIGLFVAGFSPTARAATAIAYIVYFPMLFLSGATMPMELMPQSIINFSKVLPLTYGVNLFKGLWLGGKLSDHVMDITVLLVVCFLFGGLAIKFFKWE